LKEIFIGRKTRTGKTTHDGESENTFQNTFQVHANGTLFVVIEISHSMMDLWNLDVLKILRGKKHKRRP
jgi:hypothetical protein